MTKRIIDFWHQRLSVRQQQWAWFVVLWCAGFLTVVTMGMVIKLIIGIG